MKLIQAIAAITLLLAGWASAAGKPNILVILVDDLGYGDLGYTGAKDVEIPPSASRLSSSNAIKFGSPD